MAALLAGILALPAPLRAMQQGEPSSPPHAAPSQESRLADTPVVIEELGVSIRPPIGAALSKERGAEGLPSVTIADPSPTPVWQIRVQALIPELENPTPKLLIEDHVATLKEAGHELRVMSSGEVTVSGVTGWQAFMSDMSEEEPLVNGYLIVPGQGPPFIVVSFVCTMMDFPSRRSMLEGSLDSVTIDSPERIAEERKRKLKDGEALLESFDTATLRELIGLDQWFRHYRPASEGEAGVETEIGVSHVRVREGKRGELNTDRDPAEYTAGEAQDGLLLTVQARIVLDRERDVYYDSLAMYWMGWDGATEAWSIVASRKQKGNAISEAETGIRTPATGDDPALLQVVKSGVEGASRTPKEWALPQYYMSQPIAWLLGHLMASTDAAAGDYSFYCYDSSQGSLSMRQDSWAPGENSGGGTLTTRLTPKAPPVTASYDSEGNLVERTRPDGSMTVPSTVTEIRRLWDARGLKLGSDN